MTTTKSMVCTKEKSSLKAVGAMEAGMLIMAPGIMLK